MAEVRPFPGLRYTAAADPALTIAPPYDVISPAEQRALYERSPHNVVRVEYGEQREGDDASDNRYTRAATELAQWRSGEVVALDGTPAIYGYRQEFDWNGRRYSRRTWFVAVRLEEWSTGVVKPHEHTLANPKADRLNLLRATRTQISPVYSLFRPTTPGAPNVFEGTELVDFVVDGQRHVLSAITEGQDIASFRDLIANSDVYIADGHHRYETALAYRDESRAGAATWTGDEPENFVLMGLTAFDDPGLLVLPTHRVLHRAVLTDAIDQSRRHFGFQPFPADGMNDAVKAIGAARETSFVALGLAPGTVQLVTLRDRAGVEALMPADESAAWKALDVNVLQFGVLLDMFGIDDETLQAGGAVTYTQDAKEAQRMATSGEASCAFLLNATPVEQVLAVADAAGRMPQKSTYFYPKLPTGLVMRSLD